MSYETFRERRRLLRDRMPDDAVALIFSGRAPVRSNDVHYRFRPNSDFYYLTGFQEEDCVLVLSKEESLLFLPDADPDHAIWHGQQLGVARAAEELGMDGAFDRADFARDLGGLLKNRTSLFYQYGRDAENDVLVFREADQALRRARRGETAPIRILHPTVLLHEMRLTKSTGEIEQLHECARVTRDAHLEAMRRTRPGLYEYELESIFQYHFRRAGGFEGYPAIVASGPNACVLHHIENRRQMLSGDLVLIDAGVELRYLNSDVTRTYPVSGRFSTAQRAVYDLVLGVQKRAIEGVVAGSSMERLHNSVVRALTEGLVDLGVLAGGVDGLIETGAYKPYFMHGTGHWLGIDVHDVGLYYTDGRARPFVDGMVLTVEPGLYFPLQAEDAPAEFRGIGVRIEDDIIVNGTNPINLTAEIPKEPAELEELVGSEAERALR